MTKSKFKWLIIISLLVQIKAEVLYEGTFYTLPKELQDFILKSEQLQENSNLIWVIIIFSIMILIYLIFVLNAMFKLKKTCSYPCHYYDLYWNLNLLVF
jgi:type IV secretory pathway component VirB8